MVIERALKFLKSKLLRYSTKDDDRLRAYIKSSIINLKNSYGIDYDDDNDFIVMLVVDLADYYYSRGSSEGDMPKSITLRARSYYTLCLKKG